MEGTSSVAMYVNGVRASEAEVADTAKSFSILMGMVMTRANQCDDPYVAFSGEQESETSGPVMEPLTRTHESPLFLRYHSLIRHDALKFHTKCK